MIKFYALVKGLLLNRQAFTILGLLLSSGTAFSQNVGINGTGNAPHSSAGLDVSFTDKGLLIPRVKLKSSRDTETISSPEVSLLIYNTETVEDVTSGYYYYDGYVWQRLAANSASSNWTFANGNAYFSGNLGIGVSNPAYRLHIDGSNNPLFLRRVQQGTTSDSILTIAEGIVRKLPFGSVATTSQWKAISQDISYTNGNVGVGVIEPTHRLHVKSDADPVVIEGLVEADFADSVLTISDGIVQKVPFQFLSPWVTSGSNINYVVSEGSGNVGIGLTNPSSRLSIKSAADPLYLYGVQKGTATDSLLTINNGIVRSLPLPSTAWSLAGNDLNASTLSSSFIGTTSQHALKVKTNSQQRLSIEADGSIGVGETPKFSSGNEKEKFLIDLGTISTSISSVNGSTGLAVKGATNNFLQLNVQNSSSGGKASTDIVATSNQSGGENYIDMGINSSANSQNKWGSKSDGYLFVNNGDLLLGTNTDDKNIYFLAGTEKKANAHMIISNNGGTVAIGTATIDTTVKLQVNGHAVFTTHSNSSDRRLKRNIQPLKYGLSTIQELQPVSYNWIDPNQSTQTQMGLIAQDARKVIPEIVLGDEAKEKLSINYTELIPVLINAIKEQQQKIDSQQKQIDELRELIKQK